MPRALFECKQLLDRYASTSACIYLFIHRLLDVLFAIISLLYMGLDNYRLLSDNIICFFAIRTFSNRF